MVALKPKAERTARTKRSQRSAALQAGAQLRIAAPALTVLVRYPGPASRLLNAYRKALKESQRSRRAVQFQVDVAPQGTPTITPVGQSSARSDAEPAPSDDNLEAALAAARERGRMRIAEILQGKDMLSAQQLAQLVGTSRVTINTWRKNGEILGLEGAKRGYRFPEWQIGPDGKPLPGIPELFRVLGESPWAVYRFLEQFHPELGMTGREALRRGLKDRAIETAEAATRDFG
jgi:hypothetical protein